MVNGGNVESQGRNHEYPKNQSRNEKAGNIANQGRNAGN